MRPLPLRLLVQLLPIALLACSDNQVAGGMGAGNPQPVLVGIAMSAGTATTAGAARTAAAARSLATPNDSTLVMTDAGGTRFEIARMLASCDHVEIDLPQGAKCPESSSEDDEICRNGRIEKDSSMVFDLLDTTGTGGAFRLLLPQGTYTRMAVRIARATTGENEDGIPEIEDRSIMVAGTMLRGTMGRPFRLDLRTEQLLEFRSSRGLQVGTAGNIRFEATLDPRNWLSALDIGKCLDSGALPDGIDTLVLDASYPCGDLETSSSEEARSSTGLDDEDED